jgi:DNA repair protein RadC
MQHSDDQIIANALEILATRLREPGIALSSPQTVKDFLTLQLATLEHEVFGVLWLDVKNRLIAAEDLFNGTLASATVHPREVVKSALRHNACSMIAYHCHPSGVPDPSEADKRLTQTLVSALQLVDVRILDHIIVGGMATYSFAEHGLI